MTAEDQPVQVVKPTNGMGTTGFVLSLVGIVLTCGLLCPIGLILSLIALRKQPKGLAIAGTVIGAFGSIFVVLGVLAFASGAFHEFLTETQIELATASIENAFEASSVLPTNEEGTALIGKYEDAWDNALRYEIDGTGYIITSAGKDGEFGTDDDIVRRESGP